MSAEKGAPRSLTIWCSSCLPGRPCFVHDPADYSPPAEKDAVTQWGVESPEGYVWTYSDPVIARIVSREQRKPVLRRTVTTTPWENDPDNAAYVPSPSESEVGS